MKRVRIALIHALEASMAPISAALAREWPEAMRMNLLDDSLSADVAAGAPLDDAMTARFVALADYAVAQRADAILFTCSAFGPCLDVVKARHPALPVFKPNEAMVDEAVALARERADDAGSGTIGLVASFAPTLASMPQEFPPTARLIVALADGAQPALAAGDTARHDALSAQAAAELAERGATVIALAQFSLARAAPAVAQRTGLPVLTTVDSAVRRLRAAVERR